MNAEVMDLTLLFLFQSSSKLCVVAYVLNGEKRTHQTKGVIVLLRGIIGFLALLLHT